MSSKFRSSPQAQFRKKEKIDTTPESEIDLIILPVTADLTHFSKNLELAKEFRARPFGQHSAELQKLLSLMRSQPIAGKHFLFMSKSQEEWVLGRFSIDLPTRPLFSNPTIFDNLKTAEWHVFKIRWFELFESELEI